MAQPALVLSRRSDDDSVMAAARRTLRTRRSRTTADGSEVDDESPSDTASSATHSSIPTSAVAPPTEPTAQAAGTLTLNLPPLATSTPTPALSASAASTSTSNLFPLPAILGLTIPLALLLFVALPIALYYRHRHVQDLKLARARAEFAASLRRASLSDALATMVHRMPSAAGSFTPSHWSRASSAGPTQARWSVPATVSRASTPGDKTIDMGATSLSVVTLDEDVNAWNGDLSEPALRDSWLGMLVVGRATTVDEPPTTTPASSTVTTAVGSENSSPSPLSPLSSQKFRMQFEAGSSQPRWPPRTSSAAASAAAAASAEALRIEVAKYDIGRVMPRTSSVAASPVARVAPVDAGRALEEGPNAMWHGDLSAGAARAKVTEPAVRGSWLGTMVFERASAAEPRNAGWAGLVIADMFNKA
ncbi:hypothetical protein HK101_000280 [Irineochytrium annulatum]|nr:hypothetical protein HK101_000280 [Irineochytrium annulatum]